MDAEKLASLALSYLATQCQNKPRLEWFKNRGDNDTAQELIRLFESNCLGISMRSAIHFAESALKSDHDPSEIALTDSIIIPCVVLALEMFVTRSADHNGRHEVEIFGDAPTMQRDVYFFDKLEDADFCARMLIFLEQAKANINGEPY